MRKLTVMAKSDVRRMWKTWSGLLLVCLLSSACGLGENEPGTFSVSFSWRDGTPRAQAWAFARVEKQDEAQTRISEAPMALITEDLQLAFENVPHGGPYRVVVDVRGGADKRARALYFGTSRPFYLRPGKHTDVAVELSLMATPSAADDNRNPSGAAQILERNSYGFVSQSSVTLSLAPRGASRVVVANDFALSKGTRTFALDDLKRDGGRYLLEWDLERGRCLKPPCSDGRRQVFVRFDNELAYASEIMSAEAILDRSPPQIVAASVTPTPARADVQVTLVINPSEPLDDLQPPRLTVTPSDPGFGPFERLPGGAYASSYTPQRAALGRRQFTFSVELTDRAGNRRTLEPFGPLIVDDKAPALAWGAEVVPPVVNDGALFTLRFELDEVPTEVPTVRVGDVEVECAFEGLTHRLVRCSHAAQRSEGTGPRAIAVEVRDVAGNADTLAAGSVLYDTLPRCGDGIVEPGGLERCDAGQANSNTPDAACRLDCQPRRCGDGILDLSQGEACDDGNETSGDGCERNCHSNEACGNGILDQGQGEACDDGNLLSHDGCSSACATETFEFELHVALDNHDAPVAYDVSRGRVLSFSGGALVELGLRGFERVSSYLNESWEAGPTMVYDVARQRVVLWGGVPRASSLWEWDGTRWQERRVSGKRRPDTRALPGMTYVSSRAQTLLFGGRVGTTPRNDFWAWDGLYWEELVPKGGKVPAARVRPALAYDPHRDRVVLVGGTRLLENGTVAAFQDTWEWDGARWSEMEPLGPTPNVQAGHALAYDAARARVVLVNPSLDEVWEWDGVRWETRALIRNAESHVSSEHAVGLAYDVNRGRMVVVEGSSNAQSPDGAACVLTTERCEPIHGTRVFPERLSGHAVTYDDARGAGLIFGGIIAADKWSTGDKRERYGDTLWTLRDATWATVEIEGASPPPRAFAAMAYDPLRDVTVLYGGQVGVGQPCNFGCKELELLSDTWQLEGNRFRRVTALGDLPPAGGGAAMFYDRAHQRMTLFVPAGDTLGVWHWDGTSWTKPTIGGDRPGTQKQFSLAYDPVRERAVLFGGQREIAGMEVWLDETWEWDGERFEQRLPSNSPGPLITPALTYHATRRTVVLLGSVQRPGGSHTGAWEWDGSAWQQLYQADRLDVRGERAWFDAKTHTLVGVGGTHGQIWFDPNAPRFWRFEQSPSSPQCTLASFAACGSPAAAGEVCFASVDGDHDGLIGCEDPDCYGVCFPSCGPSSLMCDSRLPYCGDGLRGALEGCASCPADCGECESLCGDFACGDGENLTSCPGDCPL